MSIFLITIIYTMMHSSVNFHEDWRGSLLNLGWYPFGESCSYILIGTHCFTLLSEVWEHALIIYILGISMLGIGQVSTEHSIVCMEKLIAVMMLGQGGISKTAYELLNLRALKISILYKNHIFQCMGKIFCVEFQRVPLKFHTKYLAHTLNDVDFLHRRKFKSC